MFILERYIGFLLNVTIAIIKHYLIFFPHLQIIFQDSSVFEMMTLAQDLGIEELKNACEDHVVSTLSVSNACTFLSAVLEMQEKATGEFICFKI